MKNLSPYTNNLKTTKGSKTLNIILKKKKNPKKTCVCVF